MKRAALLRGVNLGKRRLSMAQLARAFEELGFTAVRTLIASGNVVFEGGGDAAELEAMLEQEAPVRLGLATEFHVRDRVELDAVIAANPFPDAARDRPSFVIVIFCRNAIAQDEVAKIRAAHDGPERIAARGRELFIDYPNGQARSTLDRTMARCRWSAVGTARNWNTLLRLRAMLD